MNIILGVMMFFELLVFVIAICNCASKSCVDKETEGTVADDGVCNVDYRNAVERSNLTEVV